MHCYTNGLGSSPFARHYWGNHCLFSLPQGTKMFQFPWFASLLIIRIVTLQVTGLSHSEILGSKAICAYPKLIAAYHVLHRLREPRHPPDALTCFRLHTPHTRCHTPGTQCIAHTFSCNIEIDLIYSVLTNYISLYLQSCVSICQRSLPAGCDTVATYGTGGE